MKRIPRPKPHEKRAQMKARIAPGIWIDMEDHVHYSIPELCEHFGWPYDEEHKQIVINGLQRYIEEHFPDQATLFCE